MQIKDTTNNFLNIKKNQLQIYCLVTHTTARSANHYYRYNRIKKKKHNKYVYTGITMTPTHPHPTPKNPQKTPKQKNYTVGLFHNPIEKKL